MKTSSGFSSQIVTSLCQIAIWLCKKRMNQTFQGFSQATPIGLGTLRGPRHGAVTSATSSAGLWPAPGSEDTELGVILEPEVVYGTQTLCTRVQA